MKKGKDLDNLLKTRKLINIKQASELLAIPTGTLYQWCHYRKIRFVRIRGAIRFKLSDIEEMIEEGTFEPVTNYQINGVM